MRNWLELSDEQEVTIPFSQIITTINPSKKVSELYEQEKEKEDNPRLMMDLLDKLKNPEELMEFDEDDIEFPDYPENGTTQQDEEEIFEIEIDQSKISDIVHKILEDSLNNRQNKETGEDNQDTDKDMFGW